MNFYSDNNEMVDLMTVNKAKSWAVLGLVYFAVLSVSGCSGSPVNPMSGKSATFSKNENKQVLYLDEVKSGKKYGFSLSPWGEKVSIEVNDIYVAATHRECMRVMVTKFKQESKHSALLCKVSKNVWEPVRFFAG